MTCCRSLYSLLRYSVLVNTKVEAIYLRVYFVHSETSNEIVFSTFSESSIGYYNAEIVFTGPYPQA